MLWWLMDWAGHHFVDRPQLVGSAEQDVVEALLFPR